MTKIYIKISNKTLSQTKKKVYLYVILQKKKKKRFIYT